MLQPAAFKAAFFSIVEKSEIKTSLDFTDRLLAEIEKENPQRETIEFWPLGQILIGFVLIAVVSGILFYKIAELSFLESSPIVPFVWSLVLLFGLNHTISLSKYKAYL